jgi:hypothetical protein
MQAPGEPMLALPAPSIDTGEAQTLSVGGEAIKCVGPWGLAAGPHAHLTPPAPSPALARRRAAAGWTTWAP